MLADARDQVPDLMAGHFSQFFAEVHGYAPFPWQEALLERVLERGWPELLDVPTGLGKTAVLDIAVFLAALGSEHARRRVFLIVDRRLIVDQAYVEAREIQRALTGALPGTVSRLVRDRLSVHGDDPPVLDVTRMRGGLNWSWLWLERPDRYAIVTGTVDQVGSRLLFRGYGVGERLRPIDAALAGTDSLIIVDEAHLSDALLTTLKDVRALDGVGTGRRPVVLAMSASPGSSGGDTHRITARDEDHPVAGKRLRASKSLHPVTVTASAEGAPSATADTLAYWARHFGGPGTVTGVVANTVGMARAVFERIQGELADPTACVLLTGRVRGIDREYLLDVWYPRIKSGAPRQAEAELYVIATQTIEAGADIDLDSLVTEAASLPATVQRLGRVNRLGERTSAPVVVVYADRLRDPVYGSAREETWQWLTSLAMPVTHRKGRSLADLGPGVDVSPASLRRHLSGISAQQVMHGVQPYVPLVSASILNVWARTSPTPHPDVPVAPYLHGIGAGEPTVSVVWRADVHGNDPQGWARSVVRIPPSTEEAMELPIGAVRRWLATQTPSVPQQAEVVVGVSDLESQAPEEAAEALLSLVGTSRSALRYRAADQCEPITPQQVKPGDLLIVPSSWGGCDRYGWNPGSADRVTDVADFAGGSRRAVAIRISPVLAAAVRVLAPYLTEQIEDFVSQVTSDIDEETPDGGRYRTLLCQMVRPESDKLPHGRILRRLAYAGQLTELEDNVENGSAAQSVIALFAAPGASWNEDESPAGSSASSSRKQLTLAAHQKAVHCRAGEFAANLGLPAPLVHAVELAAFYHDEGKRDPRFQLMLHGGDRLRAAVASEFLAKSGMDPADRAALRRAAHLSKYPSGMRHEALSARIAAILLQNDHVVAGPTARCGSCVRRTAGANGFVGNDVDRDLVVHLISSHHGLGRPLLPPIVDAAPAEITVTANRADHGTLSSADTVDWTGPSRFAQLSERYGRWGLALLESIVRLADIWCSARSEECNEYDG